MKIINKCPICESAQLNVFVRNSMFGYDSDTVECKNCNFMFLENQLSDSELFDFYHMKYRELKNEQLSKSRILGDKERAVSQKHFWEECVNKNYKVLEIGSGWGINANYLLDSGFIDISVNELDDNIDKLLNPKAQKITNPFIEDKNKYDLIILSHVLEHLFDLNDKIEILKNKLSENGKLFIEVPNVQNKTIRNFSHLTYHYWFFNQNNLLTFFKKHNFNVIKYGAFGKNKYIEELNDDELVHWENNVENNKSSFIEMNVDDEKAFYLRILVSANKL